MKKEREKREKNSFYLEYTKIKFISHFLKNLTSVLYNYVYYKIICEIVIFSNYLFISIFLCYLSHFIYILSIYIFLSFCQN